MGMPNKCDASLSSQATMEWCMPIKPENGSTGSSTHATSIKSTPTVDVRDDGVLMFPCVLDR